MKFLKYFVLATVIVLGIVFYNFHDSAFEKQNQYVSSNSCIQCHSSHNKAVKDSLHSKIFHPFTSKEQIVADFENKPDFVNFNVDEIDAVIGGKWEQVFAKEINGELYPLPAKWMNLTKEWVPYKVKQWQDTPLTQKCNGCHTVGLNKKTGDFVEYSVSCESCHGPGQQHVNHQKMQKNMECKLCHSKTEHPKKDIIVSYKSATCGQCHNRGTEKVNKYHTAAQFNFPVEYLPGQNISKNFQATTPENDKKGKNWWGNGVSKNRHQEYADFAKSDHAKSLTTLREKVNKMCQNPVDGSCLKCHSADYRMAKEEEKPSVEEAKLGITCIVCHDPHALQADGKKRTPATSCNECHLKSMTKKAAITQKDHIPCDSTKVTCADCHMPRIVKTGGKFSLRSHAFKIIPPEATKKYGMPNSCQNGSCHQDKSNEWAIEEFHKYYDGYKQTLSDYIKNK